MDSTERIARKYRDRAEFIFIYGREEHFVILDKVLSPALRQDRSFDRRVAAQDMKQQFKMRRRLTMDAAKGGLQERFGGRPNSTIVIGVDRRVDLILPWTEGAALDRFLQAFLHGGSVYQPELLERYPNRPPNEEKQWQRLHELMAE